MIGTSEASMSKSITRVKAALEAAGVESEILRMGNETRTAQAAAHQANCDIDQIAKSIIFRGGTSSKAILFITAGGRQVDAEKATMLAGETLGRADAVFVRAQTGFAIGGVAPVGHLNKPSAFFDPRLLDFEVVYAAACTPHHIFSISPTKLLEISQSQLTVFV